MSRRRDHLGRRVADIGADFDAAKENRYRRRLTGYAPMGSGADYHYRSESDYLKIMERARHDDRNDIIVSQAINRLVDNVIQGGFRVDPDTGDAGVDALLRAKWREWTENPDLCDARCDQTFSEMSEKALRGALVDGDQFFLPLESGQIQVMEAHRCRTPSGTRKNVVHGILLEPSTRKPLEYWFTNEEISPLMAINKVGDITPVPARDKKGNKQVFHLSFTQRANQTRGLSVMTAISNYVGMHDDTQYAALIQQQMSAMFVLIRNREMGGDFGRNPDTGAVDTETLNDGSTRDTIELAPGTELTSQPGETIQGFSPNVPSPQYIEHVKMILTFIGLNLNLPRIILLLDASDTNFSSWRSAFDQAKYGFRRLQSRMIERYYRPIYLWKVREWSKKDPEIRTLLSLYQSKLFNHYWTPPRWGYIDPLKDAQADVIRIENRLNSRRGVLLEAGYEIEDVDRECIEDQERWILACIESAGRITQKHADAGVTWRDIASLKSIEPSPMAAPVDDSEDTAGEPQSTKKNARKTA